MADNKKIVIGLMLHRLFLAIISIVMLLMWFFIDHALYPLAQSLPIALFFAIWTILAPWIIEQFKISFLSFESVESPNSHYYFSRGNLIRYLQSLRSPSTQQLFRIPLAQISLNLAIGGIYFMLVKSSVSLFITIPIATLGGYLTVRSFFYSACLVVSLLFDDQCPESR